MTTYVLVHGAWHGGWCWRKVAPLLRAAGHVVYTPTLTGLGERVHLATPEVDLSTHVTDVVNTLFYEDLHDVVLVGHSYGGQVISGVAQQSAGRIKELVYLDSMVPQEGESVFDIIRRGGSNGPALSDDWRVTTEWDFGITDPGDLAWARRHLVPHLKATMLEKLALPHPIDDGAYGRTFILASNPRAGSPSLFEPLSRPLRDNPKWRFHEVPTGHDVMVTMPNELADILLTLA